MYKFDHPQRGDLVLERVLSAFAHPLRLEIVRRLAGEGELSCGDLTGNRPKSSMSHHFKILQEAGVISTIVRGTVHTNSLRVQDIEARYPGLLAVVVRDASIVSIAGTEVGGDAFRPVETAEATELSLA
jgi:DNA-binding transcriptional ArsR family regulator